MPLSRLPRPRLFLEPLEDRSLPAAPALIGYGIDITVPLGTLGDRAILAAPNAVWVSDGTAAGTRILKAVWPGPSAYDASQTPSATLNGYVYFVANDRINGAELWKTNGTAAGTVMVKDVNPGKASAFPEIGGAGPKISLHAIGNTLYFNADDGTHGFELWKSDGTAEGTVLVKDINPGSGPGFRLQVELDEATTNTPWTDVGGILFFTADDGTHGAELWRSDGSPEGTSLVKDIWAGAKGAFKGMSFAPLAAPMTAVNGKVLFWANDSQGTELWAADPVSGAASKVRDMNILADAYLPWAYSQTVVGDNLLVAAVTRDFTDVSSIALWKTDGTSPGTVKLWDPNGNSHRFATDLITADGMGYFTDSSNLWRSDGTPEGTVLVKDDFMPAGGQAIWRLIPAAHGFYLWVETDEGFELWKSDGTKEGTVKVKGGFTLLNEFRSWAVDDHLLLMAGWSGQSEKFWVSDGTLAGTQTFPVAEAEELTAVKGTAFFTGRNPLTQKLGLYAVQTVPKVSFQLDHSWVGEAIPWVRLVVQRSGPLDQPLTVHYQVSGGTAAGDGKDYALTGSSVTFAAGQTTAYIYVRVVNDRTDEFNETVSVTLSQPANAYLGRNPTWTLGIVDDDPPPIVNFALIRSSASEGSGTVRLDVVLSATSEKPITVRVAGLLGTAISGTDYTLSSGTLTFNAGEVRKPVEVILADDSLKERTEQVTLLLFSPGNAVLGLRKTHALSILDNDQ